MRLLLPAFALILLVLSVAAWDASGASETDPDGTVYGYETHGSGHPDYYCIIKSVKTDVSILRLPSVLEGYDVRTYASGSFSGCSAETLIVPKYLRIIEEGAFTGCTNLREIYFMGDRPEIGGGLPEGVRIHTMPGAQGWTGTDTIAVIHSDGIDYAVLPDGVAVIGGTPTDGSLSVKDAVDGKGVVRIDDYAFAGMMQADGSVDRRADIRAVSVPDGLLTIGQRAFYYNDLETIGIPDSLRDIQDEAFRACYNLGGIVFPDRIRYIGFEAFRDCHSINELVIPGTVEYVGDGAFYICKNLEILSVGSDISPRMFGYCVSLRAVVMKETVTQIGHSAFYECESLESVRIPGKVKEIGKEAFRSCVSLKELDLGDVERIGRMAFRDCGSLKSMTLPSSVVSMEGYAFADCTRLKDINAYGKAPFGDDTVFLNVDATVHCREGDVKSWNESDFGLKVDSDLVGRRDGIVSVAVVVAVITIFVLSVVIYGSSQFCVGE